MKKSCMSGTSVSMATSAVIAVFLILLLSGCAKLPMVQTKIVQKPLPISLLNPTIIEPMKVGSKWGDTASYISYLIGAVKQCNADKSNVLQSIKEGE